MLSLNPWCIQYKFLMNAQPTSNFESSTKPTYHIGYIYSYFFQCARLLVWSTTNFIKRTIKDRFLRICLVFPHMFMITCIIQSWKCYIMLPFVSLEKYLHDNHFTSTSCLYIVTLYENHLPYWEGILKHVLFWISFINITSPNSWCVWE